MTWNYSNTSVETALTSTVNAVATSIVVDSVSGFPVSFPYTLILDHGQTNREVVNVTAGASTTLTVTRGQNSTSAGSHLAGAVVVHGVVARDLQEPQDHIAASTNVHGIGGSSSVVGTVAAQTLTNKSINGGANTLTNLPGSALVGTINPTLISGNFALIGCVPAVDVVGLTVDSTGTRTADLMHLRDTTAGKGLILGEDMVLCLDDTDLVVDTTRTSPGPTTVGRVYAKNATSKPAFVADRATANTNNLMEFKANAVTIGTVDKDAKFSVRGSVFSQIAADTTTKLVDCKNSGGTSVATINHLGNVVCNDAAVGGTLGVTGVSTLASLGVTANATVGGTLGVTSTLTASGNVSVGGNLSVTGIGRRLYVRKTSDETVNNSSTLQDDDELLLAMVASATYQLYLRLIINSGTTPDFKAKFTVPASATGNLHCWTGSTPDTAASVLQGPFDLTTAAAFSGVAGDQVVIIEGLIFTSATPGNLVLQWAQNVATGSDTKVKTNSFMTLDRWA